MKTYKRFTYFISYEYKAEASHGFGCISLVCNSKMNTPDRIKETMKVISEEIRKLHPEVLGDISVVILFFTLLEG